MSATLSDEHLLQAWGAGNQPRSLSTDRRFDGNWRISGDVTVTIRKDELLWPQGTRDRIVGRHQGVMHIDMGGVLYAAKLDGDDVLVWSDGDVWTRRDTFLENALVAQAPIDQMPTTPQRQLRITVHIRQAEVSGPKGNAAGPSRPRSAGASSIASCPGHTKRSLPEPDAPTVPAPSAHGCVVLLQPVLSGRPSVLQFGYASSCGAGTRGGGSRAFLATQAAPAEEDGCRSGGQTRVFFCHTGGNRRYNAVTNTLRYAGLSEVSMKSPKWSLCWGGCPKPEFLLNFRPGQKTNHFPCSWQLGRKDLLWRNIRHFQRKWPQRYDITPPSFVMPDQALFWETARGQNPEALWIWKPINSSCGRGIRLLSSDLGTGTAERFSNRQGVVQRYIERPLLLHGRKFDLRLYVVVTSFDPLKVYLNAEGLVRLATEAYSTSRDTLRQKTMHLTNYSVNKLSAAYVKNEDAGSQCGDAVDVHLIGNDVESEDEEGLFEGAAQADAPVSQPKSGKYGGGAAAGTAGLADGTEEQGKELPSKLSFAQLRDQFRSLGLDYGLTMSRIKDVVIKTLIAVEPAIVTAWHQCTSSSSRTSPGLGPSQTCFEIYGFDVIVDEDLNPWVLEVNIAASLSSSSPLDKRIKTQLVADTLTLVGLQPPGQISFVPNPVKQRQKSHTLRTLESCQLKDLGQLEWATILDAHEENLRRGALERIFPTQASDEYLELFQTPRYSNAVLAKWLREGGERCFLKAQSHLRPAWVPEQSQFELG